MKYLFNGNDATTIIFIAKHSFKLEESYFHATGHNQRALKTRYVFWFDFAISSSLTLTFSLFVTPSNFLQL